MLEHAGVKGIQLRLQKSLMIAEIRNQRYAKLTRKRHNSILWFHDALQPKPGVKLLETQAIVLY
jgi:hypothetical protein